MSGVLGCVSAMISMTVMYPGRVARFDLLSTIGFVAKRITRWDRGCDRSLHRLMCYVMTTADEVSYGWIGDDPTELTARRSAGANFAGCPYTLETTNCCHFDKQGPNSRFPIATSCASHINITQSSTESEVASLSAAMKNRGGGLTFACFL